ncbi:hypothetical protein N7326_08150 [Corynebacterium sp. ES2794-CONJ1]|uniref:hypothetical protein n=1 Tax=unclassified Corynebacterium TaxID=2624378 RepID=UPI002169F123|nr:MULTISPECIES: hypothetical protein [unclassified Corynebacterium]MCS4490592.1 hypothetical protein [Corynebacterium sp. ES2775-CONJ]MCS4492371.1 hypothetical protein [Corynebacterium sp. ES2715-CONJ3]MCS4532437.1 hypothetical protein [Corynebacterium sp. ES2730-CONJ]MCU9519832.1 hypothetical protein [Corynebacterium sp. ES2794-CONJ1]
MSDPIYTQWAKRTGEFARLLDPVEDEIAVFPLKVGSEPDTAMVGTSPWKVRADKNELEATLPTAQVYRATTGDKPFGRSHEITIDLAGTKIRAVNEGGQDWVYLDATNRKVGQFSGGNNGVRKAITEFADETGRSTDDILSPEQRVFLSWVTRTQLESKMMSMTLALILTSLMAIAITIFTLLT